MGWLFVLLFVALAAAALRRWGSLPRGAPELTAAALLIGLAGYAWQGQPLKPGVAVDSRSAPTRREDVSAIEARRAMSERFGKNAQVVEFSETLDRLGKTQSAVTAVRTELARSPQSPDLWVALGNALVAHGNGVSPAATYAFQRAAQLAPLSPAPSYFLGLARANAGDFKGAGEVWRPLLALAPATAPWRGDLEARLAAIGQTDAG